METCGSLCLSVAYALLHTLALHLQVSTHGHSRHSETVVALGPEAAEGTLVVTLFALAGAGAGAGAPLTLGHEGHVGTGGDTLVVVHHQRVFFGTGVNTLSLLHKQYSFNILFFSHCCYRVFAVRPSFLAFSQISEFSHR